MRRATIDALLEDYDHYPQIEAEFQSALDESLKPRGPELLYQIVAALGVPRGARSSTSAAARAPSR